QQRQHLQQLHQQYVAQWHACHGGDLSACNAALTYPYATANDRQTLVAKRSWLIAMEQEAAARANRERIAAEAPEQERARHLMRQQAGAERHPSSGTRVLGALQEADAENTSLLLLGASILAIFAIGAVLSVAILGGGTYLRSIALPERLRSVWLAAM